MSRKGLNIYKRKDGRWEARYIKSHINNKPQYGYIYAKSFTEAKEKLRNINNISAPSGNTGITLYNIALEWLNSSKVKVKQSTYTKYYYILNNYIKTSFGNVSIIEITSKTITNYTHELIECENLSNKTVRDILSVIGSIIKYYKKNYDSTININITYPRLEKSEANILTDSEVRALEQYIINNLNAKSLGILITLYTGLRIGEICSLRWEDINLHEGYMAINKTVQRIRNFDITDKRKTKLIEDSPKSETSIRNIPIPNFLIPLLEPYRNMSKIYFLTETRHFTEPRVYQDFFKKCLKNCNIKDTNFHALRHTFATRCISNGVDVKSLSEMLGHSNINITLDKYVHPSFNDKKSNINKVLPLAI